MAGGLRAGGQRRRSGTTPSSRRWLQLNLRSHHAARPACFSPGAGSRLRWRLPRRSRRKRRRRPLHRLLQSPRASAPGACMGCQWHLEAVPVGWLPSAQAARAGVLSKCSLMQAPLLLPSQGLPSVVPSPSITLQQSILDKRCVGPGFCAWSLFPAKQAKRTLFRGSLTRSQTRAWRSVGKQCTDVSAPARCCAQCAGSWGMAESWLLFREHSGP